ncbi:MAG: hypothetical protein WA840_09195 [Caulobacteraceae bacterium]
MPIPAANPPPVVAPLVAADVARGYGQAQACKAVLDPLDLTLCMDTVMAGQDAAAKANPSVLLGVAIGMFGLSDRIAAMLAAAPQTPQVRQNQQVSRDVTLAATIAIDREAKALDLTEVQLVQAIRDVAGGTDRWGYWIAQPKPDWLARQAGG